MKAVEAASNVTNCVAKRSTRRALPALPIP